MALWDHYDGRVRINGLWHKLCARKAATWCRRIVLQDDVVIQSQAEADVPTKVVSRNLMTVVPQKQTIWITDPENKQPLNGLLVSRTLIPSRETDVPVRVLNITDKPIKLKANTLIANLQQGTVLSETTDSSTDQVALSPLDELVSRIGSSVSMDCRLQLSKQLQKYRAAFSIGERDIGITNMATHTIDTGNGRPVRQAMRRHPPSHEVQYDSKSMSCYSRG